MPSLTGKNNVFAGKNMKRLKMKASSTDDVKLLKEILKAERKASTRIRLKAIGFIRRMDAIDDEFVCNVLDEEKAREDLIKEWVCKQYLEDCIAQDLYEQEASVYRDLLREVGWGDIFVE